MRTPGVVPFHPLSNGGASFEEAWARQHANPQFTSHAGPSQVANREGYTLRQSDLASWHVKTFVAANDRMYEVAYLDVYTDNELFPTITRLVGKPFWIR